MLRGAIEHFQQLGCQYVQLDCLTDNDTANALYRDEGFEEVARHIRKALEGESNSQAAAARPKSRCRSLRCPIIESAVLSIL